MVETCDAIHAGLDKQVKSHAEDITILYKRTERPTWLQMWVFSTATGIVGFESAYILVKIWG